MSFKCCNATCDNRLSPQGPVTAFVRFQDDSFKHAGDFDMPDVDTIEDLFNQSKTKDTDGNILHVFDLGGSEGRFQLEINFKTRRIYIFCHKCKELCSYEV